MAQKTIQIPDIGNVVLQKRRGSRSIRLTIGHDGVVKVSMPTWSPYHVGEAFARSKVDWIAKQQTTKQRHVFEPADRVGKGHRVRFEHEHRSNITTRVTKLEVIVRLPFDVQTTDKDVQDQVHKAAIRALKQEAKELLPGRLDQLAQQHGFSYKSVSIKQLKSRWGSCSSHQEIALNCFLMQLPWDLIDYVILHELVHTRVMAHGPRFWSELDKYVSNLAIKRKTMRSYQPILRAQF
jgi:hypothetical protein